jgi:hypothetical protein
VRLIAKMSQTIVLVALIAVAGSQLGGSALRGFLSPSRTSGEAKPADARASLTARGLAPGDQRRRMVAVSNRAGAPSKLVLMLSTVSDVPGPRGGRLSRRLHVTVERLTHRGPIVIYRGRFPRRASWPLGTFKAREARRYRFTLVFKQGRGSGQDDAYQGSSVRAGIGWRATPRSGT